jgi:hypothetical protein
VGGISRLPVSSEPEAALKAIGLSPHPWSAGVGARFSPHSHSAIKRLYVVAGSIDFDGLALSAGEGIMIPAGTMHRAVAGSDGVTCIEAFED